MLTTTLKKTETSCLIDGPAGKLELIFDEPYTEGRHAWGVLCHPHPLFGGTMHNKVVTTLGKAFQGLGLNTIRFNFRGVGKSEGCFDHAKGELEDLYAVVDWLEQEKGPIDIWIGGFSFGAYIAARAAMRIPAKKLVTIAPAVEHFPEEIPPITCPWVLAQGEKDEIVSPKAVFEWAKYRNPKPVIIRFPEAGHFFHGQLGELRMRIEDALRDL